MLARRWPWAAVCTENSNPHIVVMKATENSVRHDVPDPLNGAKCGRGAQNLSEEHSRRRRLQIALQESYYRASHEDRGRKAEAGEKVSGDVRQGAGKHRA
jgi:hypothetical protein